MKNCSPHQPDSQSTRSIGQRTILSEIRRRDLGVLTDASTDCGESVGINRAVATAQVGHRSQSYVARLWRGEISLPLTYWVWGVLFNTLMRILMIALLVTNRNLVLTVGAVRRGVLDDWLSPAGAAANPCARLVQRVLDRLPSMG